MAAGAGVGLLMVARPPARARRGRPSDPCSPPRDARARRPRWPSCPSRDRRQRASCSPRAAARWFGKRWRKSSRVLIAPSQSLSGDQRRGRVVLRIRHAPPSRAPTVPTRANVGCRLARLAGGARLLGLLVDRRGLALDEIGAARILLRRELDAPRRRPSRQRRKRCSCRRPSRRARSRRRDAVRVRGAGGFSSIDALCHERGGLVGLLERVELLGGIGENRGRCAESVGEVLCEAERARHARTLQRRAARQAAPSSAVALRR